MGTPRSQSRFLCRSLVALVAVFILLFGRGFTGQDLEKLPERAGVTAFVRSLVVAQVTTTSNFHHEKDLPLQHVETIIAAEVHHNNLISTSAVTLQPAASGSHPLPPQNTSSVRVSKPLAKKSFQKVSRISGFESERHRFPEAALQNPFVQFGNAASAEPARAKIRAHQVLKIAVFGGSLTAGRACPRPPEGMFVKPEMLLKEERSCAWPARLARWLKAGPLKKSSLEMHNFGSGGSRTHSALPSIALRLRSIQPDIIIWDYAMNDCSAFVRKAGHIRRVLAKHARAKVPPQDEVLRAREQDLNEPNYTRDIIKYSKVVATVIEVFIRLVLDVAPNAMLIILFEGPPRAWSNELGWAQFDCLQQAVLPLIWHYDLPFVSYFTLVDEYFKNWSPNNDPYPPAPGGLWSLPIAGGVPIPLNAFFEASGVFGTRSAETKAAPVSVPPLATHTELAKFPVCAKPLTSFIADEVPQSGGIAGVRAKGWVLMEDVRGKPGWISKTPGQVIEFDIKFGPSPALALTYLASYEGVGSIEVMLKGISIVYTIDALWNERTSQGSTVFFRPAKAKKDIIANAAKEEAFQGDGLGGFGAKPNASYTLQLRLIKSQYQKFKVLAVFSC